MYDTSEGAVLIIDTETNALRNPSEIHVICTRTPEGETREFRQPNRRLDERAELFKYLSSFKTYVGHNFIQYDLLEVFDRLLPGHPIRLEHIIDTLVVSRLIHYGRKGGHSIRAFGEKYGVTKKGQDINVWDECSEDMVERCHSDTEINLRAYQEFLRFLRSPEWEKALSLEHQIAHVTGVMSQNGFAFDLDAARRMHTEISDLLFPIDESLARAFPPKVVPVREVAPRVTKTGAFNLNDFRWYEGNDLSIFSGGPFTVIEYVPFNPGSPQQMVERLNEAGWKPTEKTDGHIKASKERPQNKEKMARYKIYGWKVSEANLKTLPETAPKAAFDLAKRVVLQSRLSDLEEWIALAEKEGNSHVIHGQFNPIGSWTHRLSHQKPNLANVPVAKRSDKDTEFETLVNDYNDAMRALYISRPGRRLIGTDADGLQMRIFAHLVEDQELIDALIRGRKEDKTDIHSLHQRKLGEDCRNRDDAKTFIYAWLLGAGTAKVAEILKTTTSRASSAVQNFISSYPALKRIKETQIPQDAARGYFIGLDGRKVVQDSEHLMLAGYLQNGEAIIMKGACLEWQAEFRSKQIPFWMVTWPHDEWQTEIPDDDHIAKIATDIQIAAIRHQADVLGMNCPLEGTTSINKKTGFIGGYSWKDTH